MREPVGFFWRASHSQIYPELARLEDERLVRHTVIDGPGPRDTKQYRITAAGRRALATWASTPPDPAPERDELMLKVYASWTAGPADTSGMITEQLARHRARLERFERIEAEFKLPLEPSDPAFSAYATLRAGLSYERHRIAWCEWLLAALGAETTDGTDAAAGAPADIAVGADESTVLRS